MQHLTQIKTKLGGHCPVMGEGEGVDALASLLALDWVRSHGASNPGGGKK